MTDQATSVSEGVFAFKGKSKLVNIDNHLDDSKDKGRKVRSRLQNELWDDIYTQIDILRSDLNCQIFDDLIAFVSACHPHRHASGESVESRLHGEVPSAVLVTGVNTPDHDVMFTNLSGMLKTKVSPLVARVGCHDNSKINTLLSTVVAQWMDITLSAEELGENTNEPAESSTVTTSPTKAKSHQKSRKSLNLTMLIKWYNRTFRGRKHNQTKTDHVKCSPHKPSEQEEAMEVDSPSGRWTVSSTEHSSRGSDKPLLVVVFEDVESVNPAVFQDFISLCSSYLPSLPIVLILGIATAVTAIHQVLPSSITSLLCMERFQAPPASQYLSQLMDKIILTPDICFRLGPRIFHFLLDTFLYHDFSILNFVQGFRFCMTQHFFSNPLSVLCSTPRDVDSIASRLTHSSLVEMRKTSGFIRFREKFPPEVQKQLQTDDAETKKILISSIKSLHYHHRNLFPTLSFLHSLVATLPKHPLGKYFRELYSLCLSGELCESDSFKQALTFLRLMSLEDLCLALEKAVQPLQEASQSSSDIAKLRDDMNSFIYRLGHLDEEIEKHEKKELEMEVDGAPVERILPQRAKLHELKDALQTMSSKRRKSPYEKLRDEVMESLDGHLKHLIRCPLSLPLAEALYFNDLASVRDHLKASPRSSTQRALTLPGVYLECQCCQGSPESILPSMPDICIIYKLHLECGSLVNLYDWLQAFITIVTATSDTGKKAKTAKKCKATPELKARFIRAVSELQFLGFIKSTKRKTDHVTRLTW